jgi:hypothetical protein
VIYSPVSASGKREGMKYLPLVAALVVVGGCGDDSSGGSGSGGNGASCTQRLAFELVCPGDVAVGATGQVTVEGYDANNINQLSFGAAGDGIIDPPAFQVPENSSTNTNIPEPPSVFTFTGLAQGDVILTVTTFDLSEEDCSLSEACTFDVVE